MKTESKSVDDRREIRTDLSPVRSRLKKVTVPSPECCVQVVGTNGKGSTVQALTRELLRKGRRSVALLSPHLHHPRERLLINGVFASAPVANRLFEQMRHQYPDLTRFERLTMAAVHLAETLEPDYLILEAGMGGRWDATSAIPAGWLIHTGVEPEHVEYLGSSRTEIMEEQLTQISRESTLIYRQDCPPMQVEKLRTNLVQRAVRTRPVKINSNRPEVDLSRALLAELFPDGYTQTEKGNPPRLPGRFERRFSDRLDSWVILDVGHTPGSVEHIAENLMGSELEQPRTVVYGANVDKRHREILSRIRRLISPERILFPRLSGKRFQDPEALGKEIPEAMTLEPDQCFERAGESPGPVLVLGGFTVVGWFREELGLTE